MAANSVPLVGRAAEIAALEAVLGERAAAAVPVVVVHGEAGIGKTSLVAGFAAGAADRGSTVLWGASYEDSGPPYGPWGEAIDSHLATLPRERLVEVLSSDAAVLGSVAPGVRAVLRDLPAAAVLSPSEGQVRLFDAAARFFERLEEPVVVLDDMQWADASALDLVVHVARLVPGLLLVVIFRGGSLDLEDPLAIRLARVGRLRRVTYLLLEGLSRDEAGELLERAAREKLDPDLIEAMHGETRGNPFFLGELGRHIQRLGGWAARDGDSWRLPETIRGAVGLRLAAVSDGARRMLELATVFTGGFGFDELQALTGVGEVELLDRLEEALGAELLRSLGGERYDFAHALVRQALYERLSPSRRARLHRRLAEALERLYENPPARVAAEVARQYHASVTLPGAERGVAHALAAADHARGVDAPAEAVELLRLALELVPDRDEARRARVTGSLAATEAQAAMPSQAVATLESAVALLERSGAGGREIAQLTCDVATAIWAVTAIPARGAALIERALEALGDEHSLLWARLQILLSHFVEPIRSGPIRIVPFVAPDPEARRIVRAQGTEADIAITIDPAGPWSEDELEWAIAEIARWPDPAARSGGLFWVVDRLTLYAPRSPDVAEKLCGELEMLADQVGALSHRAAAHLFRSALHGASGSLDPAAEQFARARTVLERLPETVHSPVFLACEALIAQHRDPDWPGLVDGLWQAATLAGDAGFGSPLCAALACYAFAHAGMPVKARELLDGIVIPGLRAAGPWDHMVAPAVAYVAAAIWELRDEPLARKLWPAAEAIVAAGVTDWYMSSNDLTVARLATVLERDEDAAAAFRRARERLERHGQWPMRAIVDFDEAVARRWRGQPGSAELLLAAGTQFERLKMSVWLERIAGLARKRDGLPDGLTRREAEVLRLLASGLTNRQIAEQLSLSVHTVARHVNNVYVKIAARNRADAAAYAVRHGL
jgi:DNA-binding CsgD family transcriptional regulator